MSYGGLPPADPAPLGNTTQFVTACATVAEVMRRERAECALARLVRAVRANGDCPVTEALSGALAEAQDVLDGVRPGR
jgi:hypothetical protein